MNYRYSIIIPHRNIPDLLQRCLDSIPRREDVQVIIVDDNSDPAIVDFEHFPGKGEKNVEVYLTQEGRGPGYARNVGLEHVQGEWILFADADDYFLTDNLAKLMDVCGEEVNYDLLYFFVKIQELDGRNSLMDYGMATISQGIHTVNKTQMRQLYVGDHQMWKKMVRASLIRNKQLRFDEIPVCEDVLISIYLLDIAKGRVGVYGLPVYCYHRRASSITQSRTLALNRVGAEVFLKANRHLYREPDWLFMPSFYLSLIKPVSYSTFLYYVFKEAYWLDWHVARTDYLNACKATSTHPNPLMDVYARVRVSLGKIWRHLFVNDK